MAEPKADPERALGAAARRCSAPAPVATYRLQIHRDFPLPEAAAIADYLAALGVSHAYTSPILQAVPGSEHGYDGSDPTRVDAERGGEEGALRFWQALAEHGLGHLLDIVPNHMAAVTPANRWWADLLRHGRESRFARYFDVDWDEAPPVLVPILGESLEEAVASGALHAETGPDGPLVRYFEHALPLEAEAGTDVRSLSSAQLLALLKRQAYRLAGWREAQERLNYRRFFDIATLVGVRVEDPEVFDATHARILEWVRDGRVAGLRIDHPDGLWDPRGYLVRLRQAAGDAWILVEKILEREEALRPDWPVHGTTGYEFLVLVGGLFADPAGEAALARSYRAFIGEEEDWEEVALGKKRQVLRRRFRPELARLERGLQECLPPADRGVAPGALREALTELLVCFPVYRSYIEPDSGRMTQADVDAVERAGQRARARRPDLSAALEVVVDVVLLRRGQPERCRRFVGRLQQTTGPLMAKGVEDTAFYAYAPLIALNEVGGAPAHFHTTVEAFHADARRRQCEQPLAMLASSTHDTKRSGDVRARLFLLSEIPDRWEEAVRRWSRHNERHRTRGAPDRRLEYFLYQTLVGAHPLGVERALAYVEKAMREAKRHTSWVDVDTDYEAAVKSFVADVLDDPIFARDLDEFVAPLVEPGRVNALAQTLLKLTAPGVPDLYQGTELWDLSLVDPDNRRPVDYALRRRLLAQLAGGPSPEEVLAEGDVGLPKLWVIHRALSLRRQHPEAFGADAGYHALEPLGRDRQRLLAFARSFGGQARVVSAVSRFGLGADGWGDTRVALPSGAWTNRLTHETGLAGTLAAPALFARFPVALLVREEH